MGFKGNLIVKSRDWDIVFVELIRGKFGLEVFVGKVKELRLLIYGFKGRIVEDN